MLIFTVLPKNKAYKGITLSHITIVSYTSTGKKDNTHTVTPLLQNSVII